MALEAVACRVQWLKNTIISFDLSQNIVFGTIRHRSQESPCVNIFLDLSQNIACLGSLSFLRASLAPPWLLGPTSVPTRFLLGSTRFLLGSSSVHPRLLLGSASAPLGAPLGSLGCTWIHRVLSAKMAHLSWLCVLLCWGLLMLVISGFASPASHAVSVFLRVC